MKEKKEYSGVKMYLESLKNTPFLTRAEEYDIAIKLDKHRIKIIKTLFKAPDSLEMFYEIINQKASAGKQRPLEALLSPILQIKNITSNNGYSVDLSNSEEKLLVSFYTTFIGRKKKNIIQYLQKRVDESQPASSNLESHIEPLKTEKSYGEIISQIESSIDSMDYISNKLVQSGLRYVVKVAKKYRRRGLDFLELIQEGNIGLMNSIDKFEPNRGYRLTTYADWWINQSIIKALREQSRTIKLSPDMEQFLSDVWKNKKQLTIDLVREPTNLELSDRMDMGIDTFEKNLHITQDTLSLDFPIDEKDGATVGHFVSGNDNPEYSIFVDHLAYKTRKTLATLTAREEKVLRMRFGIGEKDRYSLQDIGDTFSLTRERIRQIESKAIGKMKHKTRSDKLRSFY